jgi:NifB/MoaA-like Fe-S oxidoreductase
VNDGEVLEETIFGLAGYYPGVRSVAVVPVGLTAHRGALSDVPTYGREEARRVVQTVRRYGRSMQRRLGTEFCFVADEFFLLAGKPIPPVSYYEDFAQRENGVGLVRDTLSFLEGARGRGAELREEGIRRVHLVTGESFAPVLREELGGIAARAPEVSLRLHVAENRLFGRPVTVAGLLGASDVRRVLEGTLEEGDLVLVPDEAVSGDGVFLDDTTPQKLGEELGVRMEAGWGALLAPPTDELPAGPGPDEVLVEAR